MNNPDLKILDETIEFDEPTEAPAEEKEERQITILEAWYEVLRNAPEQAGVPVDMAMVSALLQQYPYLSLDDIQVHYDTFHAITSDAYEALRSVIDEDPECLEHGATDAEDNKSNYLQVMILWSSILKQFEDEWSISVEHALPKMSAYTAAAAMLVGQNGLLNYLSQIELPYDEDDQRLVFEAVHGGVVS